MISKYTQEQIDWIEKNYKIKVSKFMKEVLDILGKTFGGLHHTEYSQWKAKDYIQTRNISYYSTHRLSLSTWDYNELTKLVLLAHIKGIRIDIGCENKGKRVSRLEINFGNRMGKRKGTKCYEGHPTLNEAIENIRSLK